MPSREIASHFDVTWQAVSHNLRVLREAGLISERRDGTRRLYRTARDQLGPLEAVLRNLWRQDLKRLEKVIERDQAEGISECPPIPDSPMRVGRSSWSTGSAV